jgi:hypothetical protein
MAHDWDIPNRGKELIKSSNVIRVAVGKQNDTGLETLGYDMVDQWLRFVPTVDDPAIIAFCDNMAVGLIVTKGK